jgi:cob(I)alamin adenosyltransferase
VKVYTKTGDGGETSLFSGGRVRKSHSRVEAYGTVDELGSLLGLLVTELPDASAKGQLGAVQASLMAIGGALADPEGRAGYDPLSWDPAQLEAWIDEMSAELPPLRAFVLAGGSRAGAASHVARAVCRRAERRVEEIRTEDGRVPEGVLPYLNRLSDALFVLARWQNQRQGVESPEWHPRPAKLGEGPAGV